MNSVTTKFNKIAVFVCGLIFGATYISPIALGGELDIPKTWNITTPETLTATDLNDNFQATEAAVDGNAQDISDNSDAIAVNLSRLPRLNTVYLGASAQILVDLVARYFTSNHLTVTAPSNGYLYIEAKSRSDCQLVSQTQVEHGIYISTTSVVPTPGTPFTHSEIFGFTTELSTSGIGNFNTRVMHPYQVTSGGTYHIWYGMRGVFATAPFCNVTNPRITATFFWDGL